MLDKNLELLDAIRKFDLAACITALDSGASATLGDQRGWTALHVASESANEEAVRILLTRGADPQAADHAGRTCLHAAIDSWGSQKIQAIKILVGAGASPSFLPSSPLPTYLTPFQAAIFEGYKGVVAYFLTECGADPTQTTVEGLSMVDLANLDEMKVLLRSALIMHSVALMAARGCADSQAQPRRASTPDPL